MKKYAVVTGASSGIGAEFAKFLSGMGYDLILVARREDKLVSLSKKLKTDSVIIRCDLSDKDEVFELYEEISRYNIHVFINNAGFGDCGYFPSTELDKDIDMIAVNVTAVHILTKLMIKYFDNKGGGYLLNVASSAGLFPAGPYMATYYATKSYVVSLTRAIAYELEENESKVYIGALCPGPVNTEFNSVANVSFDLKGISPKACARYALKQMKKRKVIIVPTVGMKTLAYGSKVIPTKTVVAGTASQQKKKIY